MTTTINRIAGLIVLAGAGLWASGCQNTGNEGAQLAEARWSRARATVMLQLADQQFKSGQLDKALVTLAQAGDLDPSFPRLYILRGQIMAEKGQGQQAIAAFEQATALDPRDPAPHNDCGVQYEKWGQFEKALACYRAAAELAPGNVAYAVAAAEMLCQLDRPAEALALIERQLASPDHEQSVALRVTAGEICQVQGDFEGAVNYFRDAARLATDDAAVLRSLALALYRAGRYEQARDYLTQALSQRAGGPEDDAAAPGRRDAGTGESPVSAARRLVGSACSSAAADRAELLAALGECQLKLRQPAKARDCFIDLTRLLPDRCSGWERLAKVALCQKNWAEAVASADKALALAEMPGAKGQSPKGNQFGDGACSGLSAGQAPPPNGLLSDSSDLAFDCYMIRGYALLEQGRPAEAVWSLQQAHRLAPGDVLPLCLLSESYRKAGDDKSAGESLVRAIQIAPDDPLANRLIKTPLEAQTVKRQPPNTKNDDRPPTVTAGVATPED